MRAVFVFVCLSVFVFLATKAQHTPRIFGNLFGGGGGLFSPCTGCPIRKCLNDKAVILGYCCGCARVSDFLPIDCPGLHLNCPSDGRRLCRDYDYMLNCCCP
ncbi:hypothetical protein RUM43_007967 [Polyplax serrata]|uniref:Uncharacterized protein n=1 Tax=Polyplax serrata TaxID=468196 RepID=A0AAN8S863_POLSC